MEGTRYKRPEVRVRGKGGGRERERNQGVKRNGSTSRGEKGAQKPPAKHGSSERPHLTAGGGEEGDTGIRNKRPVPCGGVLCDGCRKENDTGAEDEGGKERGTGYGNPVMFKQHEERDPSDRSFDPKNGPDAKVGPWGGYQPLSFVDRNTGKVLKHQKSHRQPGCVKDRNTRNIKVRALGPNNIIACENEKNKNNSQTKSLGSAGRGTAGDVGKGKKVTIQQRAAEEENEKGRTDNVNLAPLS